MALSYREYCFLRTALWRTASEDDTKRDYHFTNENESATIVANKPKTQFLKGLKTQITIRKRCAQRTKEEKDYADDIQMVR